MAALQMQRSPYFTYAKVSRMQPVRSAISITMPDLHRLPLLPHLVEVSASPAFADQDLHELPLADVD